MRYVRLDTREWSSTRANRLAAALGAPMLEAIGILAVLWHQTRQLGLESVPLERLLGIFPTAPARAREVVQALEGAGYLKADGANGLLIVDNVKAAEGRARRVKAAMAGVAGRAAKRPKKAAKAVKPPKGLTVVPESSMVWEAYARAYETRWQHPPVRNARANALIKQLVARLGKDVAINIVEFYVVHNEPLYVRKTHDLQYCVKDCETLVTQMRRNEPITEHRVRQADKQNVFMDQLARVQRGEL